MKQWAVGGLLVVNLAGCAAPAHHVAETAQKRDAFDAYPLGVCQTKRVKFEETRTGTGELTRAEVSSRWDHVSKLMHGLATIGRTDFTAPTDGDIATSTTGRELKNVQVWAVIREGLALPINGPADVSATAARYSDDGVLIQPTDSPDASRSSAVLTADIRFVDSRTGQALHGYSCATSERRSDGTTTEYRGVDPEMKVVERGKT